eukprot:TRINITY_DN2496_c0_g1_i3.p1 TRINITY_DN2496_c0_g1~~TRINITY_DN2496_c0_g1_i3.p1  ORF type:complete len:253 (+),score=29.43 TRINITY_DN2496_c0_g1_i3:29-787(+)
MEKMNEIDAFEYYEKVLKKPKNFLAPMVGGSELAYRLLVRRYGVHITYTPMFHSLNFSKDPTYRRTHFQTSPEDRPLVVQFCANNPDVLLAAAKLVEDKCDAIDINLGCPQKIAKKGRYGAFLLEEPELVYKLVSTLHQNLSIPVFCKIRLLSSLEATVQFAKGLEKSGCKLLVVHGRRKDQIRATVGAADWEAIRIIKESLTIPVISNGSIQTFSDIKDCLDKTGADGVMSAGKLAHFRICFHSAVHRNSF